MIKILDKRGMTQEDWQEYRGKQRGIGGSEIAAVIGINQYKSKFTLWLEKTGQKVVEPIDNEYVKWGTILEPVIRKQFSLETGFKVFQNNFVLQHDECEYMIANIDGEVIDPAFSGRGVLEIKTTSEWNKSEWEGDKVPDSYACQMQWYLGTTGYQYGYIVVLIGGNKLRWWLIERDEAIIETLKESAGEFMEMCRTLTPPMIGGTQEESDWVNARFTEIHDEEMMIPPTIENLALEYNDLQEEMKRIKERTEEIKNQIKLEAKDFKTLRGQAVRINLPMINKTLFDSKKFASEMPDLYSEYKTKTSSYRDFKVKILEA